jgi:ferredoxin
VASGADRVTVTPLAEFADLKPNFEEGFRTEQFFDHFTTVVTFGRLIHKYKKNIPLEDRNALHMVRPTTDRMTSGLIDVTRYLDDLGYDAIQDWTYTGISGENARRAGWEEEGKEVFAVSVICNIPFPRENRILKTFGLLDFPRLDATDPIFQNVELVSVGDTDGITYPGMEDVRHVYPSVRSIVAIASTIPERTVELACRQEAEDGGPYAYMHYEILKEALWAGEDLCDALEAQGYFAVTLPDLAPDSYLTIGKLGRHMPDLYANAPFAAAAGLGVLGKSGMLTRGDVGPRLRYVFVLTDAPLTPTEHATGSLCPADCTACASACPMKALSPERTTAVEIREGECYEVMTRDETRCMWARSLAMCEEAGSGQLGWQIPKIPVPEVITPERIGEVLAAKDKIQTVCYQCPNFTDIIVERCLQVCPIGKKP